MRRNIVLLAAIGAFLCAGTLTAATGKVCWPGFTIPAVHLPAVHLAATAIPGGTIPGGTIRGGCVGDYCYPSIKYPPVTYPAVHAPAVDFPERTIPAQHVPRRCFNANDSWAPPQTTVRVSSYGRIDPMFYPSLTATYWSRAGRASYIPDPTAPGFGELNAAGFPKNQYVRSYFRRDGTFVSGYWRNSPTDCLPTCQIIRC